VPKIQPWTFSKLSDFVNCPHSFHQKHVLKRFPYQETPETKKGNEVHKAFELRIANGTPLPRDLREHEPYLAKLEALPGENYAEREIALNKKGEPCGWMYPDVWHRGKIDFTNINGSRGKIVDYKTGKKRPKFEQLISNSIWIFTQYPEVDVIDACFYWTVDKTETPVVYKREQIPVLWGKLIPDLRQYRDAFHKDVWQKRPSGLCPWCPVIECQHWRPKPEGR